MSDLENNNSDFSEFDDSDADPNYKNSSSSSENEENFEDNGQSRKGKKRMRRGSKQKAMKELKDKGKRYKSYRGSGRDIEEKKIGDPCNCKRKCFENLSQNEKLTIFSKFWNLGDYDIQNAYLLGCLKKNNVKRRTKKCDTQREQTIQYFIGSKSVCKNAFISVHGLGRGRIEWLVKRLKKSEMVPERDGRGKHTSHKKKYDENDIVRVRDFIDRLPKYESHYSRSDNLRRVYMSIEYNNTNLYEEYSSMCGENDVEPVSIDKFRRIITEEYNISFKTPKSDTCAECDAHKIEMNQAKLNNMIDEFQTLKIRHELHLRKAQAARDLLTEVTNKAGSDPRTHVITFDLQQALPTPKMSNADFIQIPPQKYQTKLAVDENKLQHVLSCLKWVPPIYHNYYYNLVAANEDNTS